MPKQVLPELSADPARCASKILFFSIYHFPRSQSIIFLRPMLAMTAE